MISFGPVWAIVLRHLYVYKRDVNLLLSIFYWPLLDILIWGFLGSWIQNQSQSIEFHNYEAVALMGILLWQIIGRGCNILGVTLMEELWSNNIVNLFSLPLKITQWIAGVLLYYLFVVLATSLVCMCAIFMLYTVSIFETLASFMLFVVPLIFSGIAIGFIGLSIVILLGKRGTELGFVIGWFLLPFSGAYYPVDVLPHWAQMVSKVLPMSYIFHGMREYLMYQNNPLPFVIKGSLIGFVYMLSAIGFFMYCFKQSKRNGLARLVD
jgi:ABC-2 type transport system permease protein